MPGGPSPERTKHLERGPGKSPLCPAPRPPLLCAGASGLGVSESGSVTPEFSPALPVRERLARRARHGLGNRARASVHAPGARSGRTPHRGARQPRDPRPAENPRPLALRPQAGTPRRGAECGARDAPEAPRALPPHAAPCRATPRPAPRSARRVAFPSPAAAAGAAPGSASRASDRAPPRTPETPALLCATSPGPSGPRRPQNNLGNFGARTAGT